jgi:hypothetical protein
MSETTTTTPRSTDYPTGDGMSFICNRWVFTGPEGYRVVALDAAEDRYSVVRYTASETRPMYPETLDMTEDEAHAQAAHLARR